MNTVANICIAVAAGMNLTGAFNPGTPKATVLRGTITFVLLIIAWAALFNDTRKKERNV